MGFEKFFDEIFSSLTKALSGRRHGFSQGKKDRENFQRPEAGFVDSLLITLKGLSL